MLKVVAIGLHGRQPSSTGPLTAALAGQIGGSSQNHQKENGWEVGERFPYYGCSHWG